MASRTSINVSLPASMKSWVDAVVSHEGYGTTSEFIRELLRQEQKRRARSEVEDAVLLAMKDPAAPLDQAQWRHIRREVAARTVRKAGKKAG
jgi:antitoxin ParD1/3/4